ncbi:MAG: hypothetical protein JWO97_1302 [Acidobacteria bacterium]|nr:hypothetical protein [Acidobacteriota bacterium]
MADWRNNPVQVSSAMPADTKAAHQVAMYTRVGSIATSSGRRHNAAPMTNTDTIDAFEIPRTIRTRGALAIPSMRGTKGRPRSEKYRAPKTSLRPIETLYFDGPAELDWPAFAFTETDTYMVLDRRHLASIER